MATVSHLPVEVLHHILELLKQPLLDKTYIPQYRLVSLTRVCKHWQPIAERLLYQSVAIGSDLTYLDIHIHDRPPQFLPDMTSDYSDWLLGLLRRNNAHDGPIRRASFIAGHFLETIEKNKVLAAFVTELQLLIPEEDKPEEESHKFAKILSICPNVRRVKIIVGSTSHSDARKMLIESLLAKEIPVSFELENVDTGAEGWDTLWKPQVLLHMMRRWPQLEHVRTTHNTLSPIDPDDSDDGNDEDEEAELSCCPKLQIIDFGRGYCRPAMLRSHDLRNLLRMCPTGIKTFKAVLAMDEGTLNVLDDCMRAWAPTLETLVLRNSTHPEFPMPTRLSDCVANLTKLKVLALESLILDPRVLSTLPNLTHLCVAWASIEDRGGLLFTMSKDSTFPALRTLHIGEADGDTDSEVMSESLYKLMEVIIKIRGILSVNEDQENIS